MPKDFSALNYYEMLDIKPTAAPFEIRHAYNTALKVYEPDSLASYSFFSEAERRDILSLIEKAYHTLINDQARKDYHEALISRGELDAIEETVSADKKTVAIFDVGHCPVVKSYMTSKEALKNKISQSQSIGKILAQNELCGPDLKKIRTELDVPIEQIAQETKIRADHLRSMEEDNIVRLPAAVFLKGFVKSYLKCLCLEPVDELAVRYMDNAARLLQR